MTQALVVLLALAWAGLFAQPRQGIERVGWLQGCWQASSGGRTIEERWMAPRGANMLGVSRTMRGAELVGYELIVLKEEGERLAYEAHPSGQSSATFHSTVVTESRVVFENLQHDFPQQIGYQRSGDSLLAWIEGTQKGARRRVEFPYQRVACDGEKNKDHATRRIKLLRRTAGKRTTVWGLSIVQPGDS